MYTVVKIADVSSGSVQTCGHAHTSLEKTAECLLTLPDTDRINWNVMKLSFLGIRDIKVLDHQYHLKKRGG